MWRNLRPLFNFDPPATDDEVRAAALQYVRKITGHTKPSEVNAPAFQRAVDEVASASMRCLAAMVTKAPPKNRELDRQKATERSRKRFGTPQTVPE
jgi:hypothetical protein